MNDDNIFADTPREGETLEDILTSSVDKELEVEKPTESQTEKEEIKLPDEAHFLKQNEKWEQMRKDKEALEARLEVLENEKQSETIIQQPEFLTKMIGENEEVAKDWMKEKAVIKEEVKQELIREQLEAQQKQIETTQYWDKWTQDRFGDVEKEFKVDFKTNSSLKNELAKVMTDYTPTDEQGNLDYLKGMKLLTDLKRVEAEKEDQQVQVKKNIADATVSRETSTKSNKGFVTRNDLRGGWRGLVARGD